ncbi:MFS general substrate transporter [Amylostereum chailletii]|nr:MFS general substrate transporter [Amylostereum chailletii]
MHSVTFPRTLTTIAAAGIIPHVDKEQTPQGEPSPKAHQTSLENEEAHAVDADYPEGGLQAWLTVIGAVLVQFVCGCVLLLTSKSSLKSTYTSYVNAFGVYQDFLVQDYLSDYSSSQISWIGSVATSLTLATGLFSGRLFDAGHFYPVTIADSVLIALCLFMLSLAQRQSYYQAFLTLGLGYGIGIGALYVPSIAIVSHYFQRRRALAMGIASSGSSLGALLHPIMLNNLFHGSVGFANGIRASAGLITATLVLPLLAMRTRLPPRPKAQISLSAAANKFIRDDVYVIAVIATFMVVQGVFFPLFYLQLYCDQHGIDRTFGFYSLTILSSASFIGRLAGGAVVNRCGVFNVMSSCSFACSILVFAMLGLENVAGITVWAVVYGFFSGAYITLLGPMLSSLATDVSEVGARIGIAFTFTGVGALIATPITGALLTRQYHWWRPIVYIGVVSGFGAFLFTVSRFMLAKRKATSVV